jgi:putative membrane protein
MEAVINMKDIIGSIIFSVLGLVLFALAFFIFDKITPGGLGREILEKQNTAAAIVVAALMIGVAIIVGMSIHG